jgi:hypothetical protein
MNEHERVDGQELTQLDEDGSDDRMEDAPLEQARVAEPHDVDPETFEEEEI